MLSVSFRHSVRSVRRFCVSARRLDVNFDEVAHKYSSTVLLPKSDFASRSDDQLIKSTLRPQATSKLYEWNSGRHIDSLKDLFILHDGPPYANGDLHVGHALNKVLKDIIVRFELLRGKKVHYKPGWDCHGLPIELKALEKLEKSRKKKIDVLKKTMRKLDKEGNSDSEEHKAMAAQSKALRNARLSPLDIIHLSEEHALSTQKAQSETFQQMGIMGDFEHPYLTLNRSFVVDQLKIFKRLFDRGLIHRQEKPVYWGCENATALAEGELEYKQHVSKAAYVKFPLTNRGSAESLQQFSNLSALIWTSTPWTLGANLAICVNRHFTYTVLEDGKDYLLVAQDLENEVLELKKGMTKTGVTASGEDLLGCKYINPLAPKQEHPFLHGSHVTNKTGTGLVHTAPGHGQDDYFVCLQNGIKPYSPVDSHGRYTADLPSSLSDFVGLKVLAPGNDKMVAKIEKLGMCFKVDANYVHSYPYDWRSKKPIIIRATPQWFIDVSRIKGVTTEALQKRVEFHPKKGSRRLVSFINTRNEWCISRQRSWGVPIPVLYHRDTGKPLLNDAVIAKITEVIEKDNIESWVREDPPEQMAKWFPADFEGNPADYVKGRDTMDVWFDSGSSWKVIEAYLKQEGFLEEAQQRGYLADIYLEGSDQHRGWFQSSVLTKVGSSAADEPLVLPYHQIITHGFTLDEKGEKMSKSIGNTILPLDILNGNKRLHVPKLGIDGLRLWVAQADYSSDVSIGPTILKHVGESLIKTRFTFRFLLGNLAGFDAEVDAVAYDQLDSLDKFVLSETYSLEKACFDAYREYNYSKVVKEVTNYINSVLSSIYFDVRKDCLYTDSAKSLKRRATQTVLTEVLTTLDSVLSPIMPILTQEVWNCSPANVTKGVESPFMLGWHNVDASYSRPDIEAEYRTLSLVRDEIKVLTDTAMRKDKKVRNSLETRVYVTVDKDTKLYELLKKHESQLNDYLLVSEFVLNEPVPESDYDYKTTADIADLGTCTIDVVKSDKLKCPRCWKYTRDEGEELCGKCSHVVHDA